MSYKKDRREGRSCSLGAREEKGLSGQKMIDLYFGPTPPAGKEGQWIKTIPGQGWFVYLRLYGPLAPTFDGSWKPGDFEITP